MQRSSNQCNFSRLNKEENKQKLIPSLASNDYTIHGQRVKKQAKEKERDRAPVPVPQNNGPCSIM